VTGGEKLSVKKATKVLSGMSEQLDPQAQVIFGARVDPECKDIIRVMAVITGIKELPERQGARSHEREELDDTLEELVNECARR
jgi:cell division protein FtsZ